MIVARLPSYALNFYSPIVEAQLKSNRKTATIPARGQVPQVSEGDDRVGAGRRPVQARASTSSTR